jgi:hypothetical protein
MRSLVCLLTIFATGCTQPYLPTMVSTERVVHAEGFSAGRIGDWAVENNPTLPTIEQHLSLRRRGSSEVVVSVTLFGQSGPTVSDQLEDHSYHPDEILEKNAEIDNRTEVVLKKRIEKTWFRVHVSTSVDRPHALVFARLVAESIRLESATSQGEL